MMSALIMLTVGCVVIHISAGWDTGIEHESDSFAMKAPAKDFPHQAFIRLNNAIGFCGGAIIGKSHVLTVASCLFDERKKLINPSGIEVYVNGHDNYEFNTMHSVCKIEIHENFRKIGAVEYLVGNIAILTLVGKLDFGDMVKPIRLPNEPFGNFEFIAVASGFHTINRARNIPFHRLRFAQMTLNRQDCFKFWKENRPDYFDIREDQLCARSILGPSTCYGDNGNALITTGPEEKVLIGLSIFSDRCGRNNSPDVYIRAWYYVNWIKDTMRDSKC